MIMVDCEKCRFVSVCKKRPKMPGAKIAECNTFRDRLNKEKPTTNADRIRAMSDENLAEWINDTGVICNLCAYQKECDAPCSRETCIEGIAKWLQQPAEEVHADG
jgi:hypothetical protein